MCLFCDIIDNKIPSKRVYEDDEFLAILDIAQITRGHTLVMPKKHFDNIFDVDDETLAKLTVLTKKLARQITGATKAEGCNILNNCNAVAGQSIMHLHFHILPRYGADDDISVDYKPTHTYDLDEVLSELKAG